MVQPSPDQIIISSAEGIFSILNVIDLSQEGVKATIEINFHIRWNNHQICENVIFNECYPVTFSFQFIF